MMIERAALLVLWRNCAKRFSEYLDRGRQAGNATRSGWGPLGPRPILGERRFPSWVPLLAV